jgi:hypothetical protein
VQLFELLQELGGGLARSAHHEYVHVTVPSRKSARMGPEEEELRPVPEYLLKHGLG